MRILLAVSNPSLASLLEKALARFQYEVIRVENGFDAFQKAITVKVDLMVLSYSLPRMNAIEVIKRCASIEQLKLPPAFILTHHDVERRWVDEARLQHTSVISMPVDIRKFVSAVQQALQQDIRLTCLGGGTGLFTLLSGLKTLPAISLSSIVSMSDDGGSTGRLRDMFGILPPGDVRRSLVALSTAPDLLNQLIQYRFDRGDGLMGHNLGNLLLTALHHMRGSMGEAVKALGEILNIQGQVIPVTETINTLVAKLENGQVISGESRIGLFEGVNESSRIAELWQEPKPTVNPDAIEAIYNAKYVVLGPGDLFTSILSNLIVEGVSEAVRQTKAKKIYICNVMTKQGETTNFQISDHLQEMKRFLKEDVIDYVICSSTKFSEDLLKQYAAQGQIPVIESNPEKLSEMSQAKFIFADIASQTELVRHDSLKLVAVIKKILEGDYVGPTMPEC